MSDTINITVNPDGDEVTINFDDSAGAAVFAAAAEASAIAAAAAASTAAADATALAEAAANDAEDAAAAALVAQAAAQQAAADAVGAVEGAASDAAASVQAAVASDAQAAAASATQASGHKDTAAAQAAAAANSANQAASFVGGNWPLPHGHVTGPLAVDPEFQRISDAYDESLKRYEYGQRRWNTNGTLVEEGTTNLLPAGSENFVTGWSNGTGETCTVTDYPMYIEGVGNVIAKRITGNGIGSTVNKYYTAVSGLSNPHTAACSVYAMLLSGNAKVGVRWNSASETAITSTMQRLKPVPASYAATSEYLSFNTAAITDILDIVVYAPQIEAKAYATDYTPPGTTRAAETFAIPVGAYQKNLLTLNQATGGDTLGDTTGFSGNNGATTTRDTTEVWNGTGSIKTVCPNAQPLEGVVIASPLIVVGKIYTYSAYIWGSGEMKYGAQNIGWSATPITLSSTKQRISYMFVANYGTLNSFSIATNTQQAATFWIDGLQLEEGTTASDWTTPAVDYSNALIDPAQPFSIEFDAVPTVDDKSAAKRLFGVGTTNNFVLVQQDGGSLYYGLLYRYNGGTIKSIVSNIAVIIGTKAGHKINVTPATNQLTYTVNGVDISTITYDGLPSLLGWLAYFGTSYDGTIHRNAQLSNIRIRKGVALTAAERAYTGQLLPDEFTTYYSDCKESISSRPFVRVAGQARNVVLAGDAPNQNAIVNGDFRLASRGMTFSNPAHAAYLLDGVVIRKDGTLVNTVSQQAVTPGQQDVPGAKNYMRIVHTSASGQTFCSYRFVVENVETYNGVKCALNIWMRSPESITLPVIYTYQNFGSGGSTAVANKTAQPVRLNAKMRKYSFPLNLPSVAGKTIGAGNYVYVDIAVPLNAAFTLDIADIELKPADAPASFYRRDIQMLQQLGNRTLQKLPANLQLRAVNVQANYIDFESIVLPVEMRATPALTGTYAETTNWKVLNTAAVQTTGFTLALLNASANQVAFRATKTSHGLTDATLQLVTNVLLSAEL